MEPWLFSSKRKHSFSFFQGTNISENITINFPKIRFHNKCPFPVIIKEYAFYLLQSCWCLDIRYKQHHTVVLISLFVSARARLVSVQERRVPVDTISSGRYMYQDQKTFSQVKWICLASQMRPHNQNLNFKEQNHLYHLHINPTNDGMCKFYADLRKLPRFFSNFLLVFG